MVAMNGTTITCKECGSKIAHGEYFHSYGDKPICNLDCLCNIRERHWEEPYDGEEIQHHDPWYRRFYDTVWEKFVTLEKEK